VNNILLLLEIGKFQWLGGETKTDSLLNEADTCRKYVEPGRPSLGKKDRFGHEIPDGEYQTKDFERVIALRARTQAIARHLAEFMRNTDRFANTLFQNRVASSPTLTTYAPRSTPSSATRPKTAALAASRPAVLERGFRGELWCLPPSSPLYQKFDERFRVINIDLA
jgi:hypothetical protein